MLGREKENHKEVFGSQIYLKSLRWHLQTALSYKIITLTKWQLGEIA